jgi:hypothetical protein
MPSPIGPFPRPISFRCSKRLAGAPSSYNEQPWSYIVATKEDSTQFPQILSCLVEGNQAWAKAAPVLALGIVSLKFAHNAKDNRAARSRSRLQCGPGGGSVGPGVVP